MIIHVYVENYLSSIYLLIIYLCVDSARNLINREVRIKTSIQENFFTLGALSSVYPTKRRRDVTRVECTSACERH